MLDGMLSEAGMSHRDFQYPPQEVSQVLPSVALAKAKAKAGPKQKSIYDAAIAIVRGKGM